MPRRRERARQGSGPSRPELPSSLFDDRLARRRCSERRQRRLPAFSRSRLGRIPDTRPSTAAISQPRSGIHLRNAALTASPQAPAPSLCQRIAIPARSASARPSRRPTVGRQPVAAERQVQSRKRAAQGGPPPRPGSVQMKTTASPKPSSSIELPHDLVHAGVAGRRDIEGLERRRPIPVEHGKDCSGKIACT